MRYRKLRIAWSVGCGIASVLLIVLWVRSHSGAETVAFGRGPRPRIAVMSSPGEVALASLNNSFDDGIYPRLMFDWAESPDYPYSRWNKSFYPRITERQLPSKARFRWVSHRSSWYICAPYWFLSLVAVGLAGVPWMRFHFTLRTLLIATTLVALVLGAIVWAVRQS
jgi:hypothetical protein